MFSSVNKVFITGNIGKDPVIRVFNNNDGSYSKMATFSVAVSSSKRTKEGGFLNETDWINVVCLNTKLTELIEKHVSKGTKVHVEGSLKTRTYTDNSNIERRMTEVVISPFSGQITILSAKTDHSHHFFEEKKEYKKEEKKPDKKEDTLLRDLIDDEIPF